MKRWGWVWNTAVLVTGAAALAWYLWREHARDAAAWARIQERAEHFEREQPRGPQPRRPLRGPARPGEAGACYLRAAELLHKVWPDYESMQPFLDVAHGTGVPEDADALLAPLLPALAAVADGAASETVAPPDPQRWVEFGLSWGPLGSAGKFAVRAALAKGDARAALGHTAAFLGLAFDESTFGISLCELLFAFLVGTMLEPWTEERLRAVAPEQLHELAALLAELDARCAPSLPLATVHAEFVWAWRDSRSDAPVRGMGEHQLSGQLAFLEFLDGAEARTATGWTARENLLRRAVKQCEVESPPDWLAMETYRRRAIASLRLLRLAVLHHAGEPLPALADPLGDGDLEVVRAEGELLLRSRGSRDDGQRIERRIARR